MTILARERLWVLQGERSAYALGLNDAGYLVHTYWGARMPDLADYPAAPSSGGWASFNGPGQTLAEEYPAWAGLKYIEPCLKATFADGVRDVVLRFVEARREGDALTIELRDAIYPLAVELHYRLHAGHDLIERWAVLRNLGSSPIALERVWSAQWHVPTALARRLSHLTGRWADEWHLERVPLARGVTRLESRRLVTSHHHHPWFALDDGRADEDSGEVWFGVLAWSGSWALAAEVTDFGQTRMSLGISDWDFGWRLDPGADFTTPVCIGGWVGEGFGAASRVLHDYTRDQVLPHRGALHPVLYNSWEATAFDVTEAGQAALAEIAAELGVELFVIDDGWFKGRTWDDAGLGDWTPDPVKFPNGLTPLIERVNALGMDFGLWIEPEMVNPNSDLYRAHPDWTIHFPTRERTTARNQLMLNLARTDVQDYLIDHFDRLLREHKIAFIKWDMNRSVSEPGWPNAPGDARELWVRYVEGVYRVWGTLRSRHPHVIWQSCSGGGGRADLGIFRFADQAWISDNTDPIARLAMQEVYSQVYPAVTMEAWVTDMNLGGTQIPLDFRFHVSMSGVLGIGADIRRWGPEERAAAARWVALYKAIRPLVQYGDQYRLLPAQGGAYSAVQYMARDKREGVLFTYCTQMHGRTLGDAPYPTIRLRGLLPDARYTVEGVSGARSGLAWARIGFTLPLGDLESAVRRIERVD